MGLTKKSITISQDLYEATKNISDNFSSVVAAAIEEYLKKSA
jgi:post-segregation antitoxin (ccd killing protein)